MIRRFVKSEAGNIAMMFGLLLLPLLAMAGMAVDLSYASMVRSAAAESSDAALLAAARAYNQDKTLTTEKVSDIAWKYFQANLPDDNDVHIKREDFIIGLPASSSDKTFTLTISGFMDTKILGVVGTETMPINILSEAKIGAPRALEVALVLDNTFSMTGSKIDALKTAANDLVDTIMKDTDNTTKVALVPFSQYVNVGLSNRDKDWLDVDDDSSTSTTTPNVCRTTYPDRTKSNCVTTPRTCSYTRDGVEVTYNCDQESCDVDDGDPVEVCEDETRTTTETWRGCVGSRSYPFNVQDRQYDARPVPGLMNEWCTNAITPLSDNKTTVKNAVSAMNIQGSETYLPSGFVWGYRALSPQEPFDEGVAYEELDNNGGLKVLIVMSDGENTVSPSYPEHTIKDNGLDADRIFEESCDEAKSNDIQIYSIAFEVTDSNIRQLLEDCASNADQYFDADDADELQEIFQQIADNLVELALTR